MFNIYVMAKASASRKSQTVAEGYEEYCYRRFGASESFCHDQETGFILDFFWVFSRMVGQLQQATMAYRPQANGTAERIIQTLTRSITMYVIGVEQWDWNEDAEHLKKIAMNTTQDRKSRRHHSTWLMVGTIELPSKLHYM